MTKRQVINSIIEENPTAAPEFLAQFDQQDLLDYLQHLRWLGVPRLSGSTQNYDRYFEPYGVGQAVDLSLATAAPAADPSACPGAIESPVSSCDARCDEIDRFFAEVDASADAEPQPADPRQETVELNSATIEALDDTAEKPTYEAHPHLLAAAVAAESDEQEEEPESWMF